MWGGHNKDVEQDGTRSAHPRPCGSPCPLDSMRDAVFTVSPKRQYRGIFSPTTPAHTGPGEGEGTGDRLRL